MSGSYDTSLLGRSSNKNVTRVKTENIAPSTFLTFQTVVPPNFTEYTQIFSGSSVNLNDPNMQYCITRITAVIDTSGIYNVPITETFTVLTNGGNPTVYTIKPGFYVFDTTAGNTVSINSLMFCKIFTQGPNSYKPYITLATNQSVTYGPYVAKLLGLVPYASYPGKGPTPNQINDTPSSNSVVDGTAGLDTISIGCDLVDLASTVSPNYVIMVGIEANSAGLLGGVLTRSSSMVIPINKKSFNTITWRFFNRDGQQVSLGSAIVIHTEISGWRI